MAKINTSNRSLPLILVLFISLLILPVIGFYAGAKYRSYQLKTYTDRLYNFTFQYPSNWFIDKNECVAGEIKIGNDKEYIVSVRSHPRGDREYIEKIWKTQNCIVCDYDAAPIPYTDIKTITIGKNSFYWNKDASGTVHAFITTP